MLSFGFLDTLAAAYAEAGKFYKAVEFQQKAVELATKEAGKQELRDRLRLYQDGRPYRMAAATPFVASAASE
ncbi:MAG: hypothetical protein ACLP9L_16840 [Thermoguttaceae bacterium]